MALSQVSAFPPYSEEVAKVVAKGLVDQRMVLIQKISMLSDDYRHRDLCLTKLMDRIHEIDVLLDRVLRLGRVDSGVLSVEVPG